MSNQKKGLPGEEDKNQKDYSPGNTNQPAASHQGGQQNDCCEDVKEILEKGVKVELTTPGGTFQNDVEDTWQAIEDSKINFTNILKAIDNIIDPAQPGGSGTTLSAVPSSRFTALNNSLLLNSQAYNILKFAMESFVRNSLDIPDQQGTPPTLPPSVTPGVLPYYEQVMKELNDFLNNSGVRYNNPFFKTRLHGTRSELIWSYWHEEGMMVQTINAIAMRFQNIANGTRDPLANFELDSLRPMANILWGYVQDAQHRLSIVRRNYEYQSQYGIRLFGKAAPDRLPVSNRSNFIAAFHNLLHKCSQFFKQVDDLTIRADAFPVLNALREVNLLLTEGMHNQFNDLSLTARIEMMIEQWILSRKEIKEFLRGKAMVIYDEPWMGTVDTMKTIQGWQSTSIKLYHELAEFGEDILLSIRFTMWSQINDPNIAALWANRFRSSIQRYIYSYQGVTGVDLTAENVSNEGGKNMMPGILIQQRYQKEKAPYRNF
jgi:hypothetical protein